jgi:hypothetical protein
MMSFFETFVLSAVAVVTVVWLVHKAGKWADRPDR